MKKCSICETRFEILIMSRKKHPISSSDRVRMHRKKKKLMDKKQKELQEYLANVRFNNTTNNDIPRREIPIAENIEEPLSLRNKLKEWVNNFNISLRAVDGLLSILVESGINSLPKSHRTLLSTPTNNQIEDIAGGKFWYNGLAKSLRQIFRLMPQDLTVRLKINIDGLPLFNSSNLTFYPILASICGMFFSTTLLNNTNHINFSRKQSFVSEFPNVNPIVVAIWCGRSKPTVLNDYLEQFVTECNDLIENGLVINDHKLTVKLHCFICDTPARSFLKG